MEKRVKIRYSKEVNTEKLFRLMYYSRFRKEVGSDSQVGILNPTNIFLDISHYMSVNYEGIKRVVRSKLKFGKKI